MKQIATYILLLSVSLAGPNACRQTSSRPNILFVISDDQSYPHASAYGCTMVSTPGFDLVAAHGALFSNFYVTSPGCSPSRAGMLTGLYPWQLEEAGTHAGLFPAKYITFPDLMKNVGYHIGYTGKGWAPGDWKESGRPYNPAGPEYNGHKSDPPYSGISKSDYTANFKQFLKERKRGQPFCFWIGIHEPHRDFEEGSWKKEGYRPEQASVPGFLPPAEVIKGDLLDYAVEIEWFDSHLLNCINELKRIGEFDNTIIIVTSDNGMSFPHAKANCYDAGIHVPLAVCWGDKIRPGQIVDALVSAVDLAPTLTDAAKIATDIKFGGQSFLPLINGHSVQYVSEAVFAGRERHSFSRYDNKGYPVRAMRRKNYLLVHNFHPERRPAGDPQELKNDGTGGPQHGAYYDIDTAPSKTYLTEFRDFPEIAPYFNAAVSIRPEYELFDLKNDADCMNNVAEDPSYADVRLIMQEMLDRKLIETGDPRTGEYPDIWESYPRLEGETRTFPSYDKK